MKVWALLFLLPALAFLPGTADAGAGGIEGRVTNGTRGGGSTEGLVVTILPGSLQGEGVTTRTDALGQFSFPGLSLTKGTYTVAVRYQGLDYAEKLEVTGPGDARLLIYVYEVQPDADTLKVVLDHHIVEVRPEDKRLNIVNYLQVINASDRTALLTADSPGAGLFPVADGAENVEVLEGPSRIAYERTDAVRAVPPGEHKLLLGYELSYTGSELLFRRPIAYPTERAALIISDNDGRAQSEQLPQVEEVENASGSFYLLTGEGLEPGGVLEVKLSDLPGPAPSARSFAWMAPVVAVVIAAGVGLMLYLRVRGRRAQAAAAG